MSTSTWKPSQLIPQFFVYTFNALQLRPEMDRIVEFSPLDRKILDVSNERYTVSDLRNGILPTLIPTASSKTYVFFHRALERLLDPTYALEYLCKHFPTGCIEMTSPLVSSIRQVADSPFRGNPLNHHIMWSHEGVLHILPKHPVFPALAIKSEFEEETRKLLTERPYYQTLIHSWDEEHPLRYQFHSVENVNDMNAYHTLYTQAIEQCVPTINSFFLSVLERIEPAERLNEQDSTVKDEDDEESKE